MDSLFTLFMHLKDEESKIIDKKSDMLKQKFELSKINNSNGTPFLIELLEHKIYKYEFEIDLCRKVIIFTTDIDKRHIIRSVMFKLITKLAKLHIELLKLKNDMIHF